MLILLAVSESGKQSTPTFVFDGRCDLCLTAVAFFVAPVVEGRFVEALVGAELGSEVGAEVAAGFVVGARVLVGASFLVGARAVVEL